ncbi:hypothetical protein ACFFJI_05085 [Allobacillus sp. GCM10007491]|uniref:DUF3278 domain-containing protein n=1 Tax=Allobacillus saliphilus TaxID=2912308 RepID=A0A941HT69_9BACI|nr:hypothetical protein [Allobacillus saliphilus]MBR7554123.1 hypothetical protein [Allobacillus saliphilus]
MKTWLSLFLPTDEYKRQKLLLFIAEGGVLLVLAQFLSLIIGPFESSLVPIISIGIFVFYVTFRYIISGMEYTEVATQSDYKKERKNIVMKSLGFGVIFTGLNFLVQGEGFLIIEPIIMGLLATLFFFLFNWLSLKQSFNKNRELMDE